MPPPDVANAGSCWPLPIGKCGTEFAELALLFAYWLIGLMLFLGALYYFFVHRYMRR